MSELRDSYKQAIWELKEALQEEKQMEAKLEKCLGIMKDAIGCEAGFLWVFSEEMDMLVTGSGFLTKDRTGMAIRADQGIPGRVMSTGETMTQFGELRYDSPLAEADDAIGIRAFSQLATPLETPGDRPFGCLHLINKYGNGPFTEEDIRLAENLTSIVATSVHDKGFKIKRPITKKPILELQGIIKEFQSGDDVVRVLKGVDLNIYPGEFLVVLGESGCGKTTMMNIIGGMDEMTEGRMLLDGVDFSHPDSASLTRYRRDYIGFIFQSYNLMPNLSALENLQFIAEISKNPHSPKEMLEKVGLSDRADNFPSQMSGGQQQRVSIARALTKNPKMILADEPTAALDYETSIEVLSIVENIVREDNKTVVMITHNPEIAKMADRVIKLRNGRISSTRLNVNPLPARELVW